jgi:hypothetical protein
VERNSELKVPQWNLSFLAEIFKGDLTARQRRARMTLIGQHLDVSPYEPSKAPPDRLWGRLRGKDC